MSLWGRQKAVPVSQHGKSQLAITDFDPSAQGLVAEGGDAGLRRRLPARLSVFLSALPACVCDCVRPPACFFGRHARLMSVAAYEVGSFRDGQERCQASRWTNFGRQCKLLGANPVDLTTRFAPRIPRQTGKTKPFLFRGHASGAQVRIALHYGYSWAVVSRDGTNRSPVSAFPGRPSPPTNDP